MGWCSEGPVAACCVLVTWVSLLICMCSSPCQARAWGEEGRHWHWQSELHTQPAEGATSEPQSGPSSRGKLGSRAGCRWLMLEARGVTTHGNKPLYPIKDVTYHNHPHCLTCIGQGCFHVKNLRFLFSFFILWITSSDVSLGEFI